MRGVARLLAAAGAATWLTILLVSVLKEDAPGFLARREASEWLATVAWAMVAAVPVRLLHAERVAFHPLTLLVVTVALFWTTLAEIPDPGAFAFYFAGFTYAAVGFAAGTVAAFALYRRSPRLPVPESVSPWVTLSVASIGCWEILLGTLVSLGLSTFGTALFDAGVLTLAAGILSVAFARAKWKAGLAVPASPVAAILAYLVLVFVIGDYVPPTAWEIPNGYRGWVITAYDMPTCTPLERDGLVAVVRVDPAGHACTSDRWRYGWVVSKEVFFVDRGRRIEKIPDAQEGRDGGELRVRGRTSSQIGGCPMVEEFFVGTDDDQRRMSGTPYWRGLGCDLRPAP